MTSVITVRLPNEDVETVKQMSALTKKDKSTVLRELVELGKVYLAIKEYKKGKISIGRASEISGLPISEMMDLLAELGIKSNLEVEDYLEGAKVAKELIYKCQKQ